MQGYKLMMAGLVKYQGKDGMWRQLIDKEESWPESSSSAMFSFAMITGVKHGWLDGKTYGPAARRGWIAVAGYIDQNNDITQVGEGTNKKADFEYYFEHGSGGLATSMGRRRCCGLRVRCCVRR